MLRIMANVAKYNGKDTKMIIIIIILFWWVIFDQLNFGSLDDRILAALGFGLWYLIVQYLYPTFFYSRDYLHVFTNRCTLKFKL